MLKGIRKFLNSASAEQQEEVNSEMTTQETQPTLAVTQTTTELQAQLATATEQLTKQAADLQALTEMVEEMSAQMASTKAALADSEAVQVDLVAQAATKRLESRTVAIKAAVGDSQLESLLAATDKMDDAQFEVIVGAMAKSFETEAKSAMFQEKGVSAAAEAPEPDVAKRLAKKMAAKIQTK